MQLEVYAVTAEKEIQSRNYFFIQQKLCVCLPHAMTQELLNRLTFLGDINTGTWPSMFGESQMRQYSKVMGSVRLEPLSDCTANWRPILSSERAPHKNKTATF
jgi:hypothetical protein